MDILHAIGNTSMVRLRKVVPPQCADIFVKLEWENPTGSVKDRMADAVISRAEEEGRLKPGDTVVEYTGGSTGGVDDRRRRTRRILGVAGGAGFSST
jgi:cysteine synthase